MATSILHQDLYERESRLELPPHTENWIVHWLNQVVDMMLSCWRLGKSLASSLPSLIREKLARTRYQARQSAQREFLFH